jgi:hypothetical protein
MGPSGGGKTYSALRLAEGIRKVQGGKTGIIDTEAKRALHYADRFDFEHLEFQAPFGSLDYLEAIKATVAAGCTTVIVDSMSHEHEGPGGVLESHEAEAEKIAKLWKTSVQNANMAAWGVPKANRRRLINEMLQMPVNFILCFRAKEKLRIAKGSAPQPMGYMAIAGEEFVYECALCALLLPGAGGVPTWQSDELGERAMVKLPEQFRKHLLGRNSPLDEATGEMLARWASGNEGAPQVSKAKALTAKLSSCESEAELQAIRKELGALKGELSSQEVAFFKVAFEEAAKRVAALPQASE